MNGRMSRKARKAPKISGEFAGISLGDARLSRRCLDIVNELNANPSSLTINGAFDEWAGTKAAYNFFANEKCQADKLIEPHIQATVERMKSYPFVYAASDTTFINYNNLKQTVGLGSIGRNSTNKSHVQGAIAHVTYAIAPNGLPLGILSFEVWTRPPNGYGDEKRENNESDRWLRHMEEVARLYPKGTRMVYLADRESDLYEIFTAAKKLKIEIVIRSKYDRRIEGDRWNLTDFLQSRQATGKTTIEVNSKGKQDKRNAVLEIKNGVVRVEDPNNKKKHIELTIVCAEELNPPSDKEKIYWRLLTMGSVDTLDDCLAVIKDYKMRWGIEILFKVVKSGCSIETCRLQHVERIIRYLAVMFVIGWRIAWKVHINRTNPKAPWSLVLTELEYKTLWIMVNKRAILEKKLPRDPPSDKPWNVRDSIRGMAKIGGFNGRKGDGEPGIQKIWEGWIGLQYATKATEIFL